MHVEEVSRDKQINFRVSEEEAARFEAVASQLGLSLASMIRMGDDDHIAHCCADIRPRLDDIAAYARNGEVEDVESEILRVLRSIRSIELAAALARASAAQEWAVVAKLARELEARRLSAAGVRSLLDERGRRPEQK
jgi:hypothetical protein